MQNSGDFVSISDYCHDAKPAATKIKQASYNDNATFSLFFCFIYRMNLSKLLRLWRFCFFKDTLQKNCIISASYDMYFFHHSMSHRPVTDMSVSCGNDADISSSNQPLWHFASRVDYDVVTGVVQSVAAQIS